MKLQGTDESLQSLNFNQPRFVRGGGTSTPLPRHVFFFNSRLLETVWMGNRAVWLGDINQIGSFLFLVRHILLMQDILHNLLIRPEEGNNLILTRYNLFIVTWHLHTHNRKSCNIITAADYVHLMLLHGDNSGSDSWFSCSNSACACTPNEVALHLYITKSEHFKLVPTPCRATALITSTRLRTCTRHVWFY